MNVLSLAVFSEITVLGRQLNKHPHAIDPLAVALMYNIVKVQCESPAD
jgi:hypothetical protein